jgi:hypothetical protein
MDPASPLEFAAQRFTRIFPPRFTERPAIGCRNNLFLTNLFAAHFLEELNAARTA